MIHELSACKVCAFILCTVILLTLFVAQNLNRQDFSAQLIRVAISIFVLAGESRNVNWDSLHLHISHHNPSYEFVGSVVNLDKCYRPLLYTTDSRLSIDQVATQMAQQDSLGWVGGQGPD